MTASLALRERLQGWQDVVPALQQIHHRLQQQEADFYARQGMIEGAVAYLLNDTPPTDPGRWDAVLSEWDGVSARLAAVIAAPIDPNMLTATSVQAEVCLRDIKDLLTQSYDHIAAFEERLLGQRSVLETSHTATIIARDISFAVVLGMAAVVAAPVAYTTAAAAAAGAGITGTTGTLVAGGTTMVAMGTVGANFEAGARAGGAFIVEGSQFLEDLAVEGISWEDALAGVDWQYIAAEGWDGLKKGFIDGALAYLALGAEAVLHKGSSLALSTILKEEGATLIGVMMRRAMEHALAGGASGAVFGALDAGLKTAVNGATFDEIAMAMEQGFIVGAALGAGLGAVGGAVSARGGTTAETSPHVDGRYSRLHGPGDSAPPSVPTTTATLERMYNQGSINLVVMRQADGTLRCEMNGMRAADYVGYLEVKSSQTAIKAMDAEELASKASALQEMFAHVESVSSLTDTETASLQHALREVEGWRESVGIAPPSPSLLQQQQQLDQLVLEATERRNLSEVPPIVMVEGDALYVPDGTQEIRYPASLGDLPQHKQASAVGHEVAHIWSAEILPALKEKGLAYVTLGWLDEQSAYLSGAWNASYYTDGNIFAMLDVAVEVLLSPAGVAGSTTTNASSPGINAAAGALGVSWAAFCYGTMIASGYAAFQTVSDFIDYFLQEGWSQADLQQIISGDSGGGQ